MQASRKRLRLACGLRQAVVQLVGCVYRLLAGRPAPGSSINYIYIFGINFYFLCFWDAGKPQALAQLVGCVYRLLAGRPAPASDPPRGGGHAKISEIATQISEIATEIPKIATQISEIATEISEIATETSEIATEIPEVAAQIPEVATRRF